MALIAMCAFVVGMLASVPMFIDVARDLPSIARILPVREPEPPPGPVLLRGVFAYQQQRPLSCEYASVHIATSMLGQPVSEYAIEAVVPLSPNPHEGYRGDIMGTWGNTDDYGVYNQPLANGLAELGIESRPFYGQSEGDLIAELDAGRPVIVWLGMWGDAGSFDAYDANGTRFQLTTGMHVMVVYGYDAGTVYITDPGTAALRQYGWDEFLAMWRVMDGMALSVHGR